MRHCNGGKGKKADDLADSCVHACNWVWEHWVKSGFNASSVSWQGALAKVAFTLQLGFGRPETRRGLDGIEGF